MLPRVLEPEVMDSTEEASEYDAMTHSQVNARFVEDFLAVFRDRIAAQTASPRLLDLGTGTALIPLLLLSRWQSGEIWAIDQSAEMLAIAQQHAEQHPDGKRLHLQQADSGQLPWPESQFDIVISNSLIHHLPKPQFCLQEAVRVLQPGGLLFIRDLFRPENEVTVESLVQQHAAGETPFQQQLLRQSLHAALTPEELEQHLAGVASFLDYSVTITSDRHWTLVGQKLA